MTRRFAFFAVLLAPFAVKAVAATPERGAKWDEFSRGIKQSQKSMEEMTARFDGLSRKLEAATYKEYLNELATRTRYIIELEPEKFKVIQLARKLGEFGPEGKRAAAEILDAIDRWTKVRR